MKKTINTSILTFLMIHMISNFCIAEYHKIQEMGYNAFELLIFKSFEAHNTRYLTFSVTNPNAIQMNNWNGSEFENVASINIPDAFRFIHRDFLAQGTDLYLPVEVYKGLPPQLTFSIELFRLDMTNKQFVQNDSISVGQVMGLDILNIDNKDYMVFSEMEGKFKVYTITNGKIDNPPVELNCQFPGPLYTIELDGHYYIVSCMNDIYNIQTFNSIFEWNGTQFAVNNSLQLPENHKIILEQFEMNGNNYFILSSSIYFPPGLYTPRSDEVALYQWENNTFQHKQTFNVPIGGSYPISTYESNGTTYLLIYSPMDSGSQVLVYHWKDSSFELKETISSPFPGQGVEGFTDDGKDYVAYILNNISEVYQYPDKPEPVSLKNVIHLMKVLAK
ncbi:hypothetical protein MHK_003206 [Candidatus Magnetomorum sp. HK-1]|nr:hypothetical protein MHK_003206 [Candidatus Magnetomorum sp. HK-1]